MDIKGDTDRNTVIVRDFSIPLTSVDSSSTQEINQVTAVLNNTLHQMYLIDVFKTFHPKAAEHT